MDGPTMDGSTMDGAGTGGPGMGGPGTGGPTGQHGVALLWIPLGAGARLPVVRWDGLVYESMVARRERRAPQPLFHAALEVGTADARYVVEMTPAWGGVGHTGEGAVATGPVGLRVLGRSRVFRYDELGTGDMWNSNSLVAWLLAMAGIPTTGLAPPRGGRAPGWTAGLAVAATSGGDARA